LDFSDKIKQFICCSSAVPQFRSSAVPQFRRNYRLNLAKSRNYLTIPLRSEGVAQSGGVALPLFVSVSHLLNSFPHIPMSFPRRRESIPPLALFIFPHIKTVSPHPKTFTGGKNYDRPACYNHFRA